MRELPFLSSEPAALTTLCRVYVRFDPPLRLSKRVINRLEARAVLDYRVGCVADTHADAFDLSVTVRPDPDLIRHALVPALPHVNSNILVTIHA
jgi:hypothetical protein